MHDDKRDDPPPEALAVGELVHDAQRDRIGVYMGQVGCYMQLRPVGGGLEWDARPADVHPIPPQRAAS